MPKQQDIKKEWEKTKAQLQKFSKEATQLAIKGEKELVKFTKVGRLHIESTAISLKKEQLYFQIGKEYTRLKNPAESSANLKKLVDDLHKAEKDQRSLKRKIKTSNRNKKS